MQPKLRQERWWQRPVLRAGLWIGLFAAGLAVWILYAVFGDAERSWRAVLVNFLYFTPLAGGLVTWSAIVVASHGKWTGPLEHRTLGGSGFAIPSLLALAGLWVSSPLWAPWYGKQTEQGAWLNNTLVFLRDGIGLGLFWAMAALYARWRIRGKVCASGGWLILVYCIVFSLIGFDLAMALVQPWASSLYGAYFFISGLYIAVAAWAFLSAWQPDVQRERLGDLGKLIVAFCMLTTYMMYSQLLPYWYENMPAETEYLVPRINYPRFAVISWILLGVVYLGPIAFLLARRAKRTPWILGSISLLILAGMWLERWWLIYPRLDRPVQLGLAELAMLAVFLAMFGFTYDWRIRRLPERILQEEVAA